MGITLHSTLCGVSPLDAHLQREKSRLEDRLARLTQCLLHAAAADSHLEARLAAAGDAAADVPHVGMGDWGALDRRWGGG